MIKKFKDVKGFVKLRTDVCKSFKTILFTENSMADNPNVPVTPSEFTQTNTTEADSSDFTVNQRGFHSNRVFS